MPAPRTTRTPAQWTAQRQVLERKLAELEQALAEARAAEAALEARIRTLQEGLRIAA